MDRSHMNIELHGPGRAGGALAIAAHRAGHTIVGVEGRSAAATEALTQLVPVGEGTADLRVIAVSDDAIESVARALADRDPIPTVHISGAVPVSALATIEDSGTQVGAFHPLQTIPDPTTGADRLPGAWIAITATGVLRDHLVALARSLGCTPFDLSDDVKPLYHAAAASAANYPLAALALAERLFEAAGVPFKASQPLVEAIVANAYALGPMESLTGPIARGDVGTVARQVEAVKNSGDAEAEAFAHFSLGTAVIVDAGPDVLDAIE